MTHRIWGIAYIQKQIKIFLRADVWTLITMSDFQKQLILRGLCQPKLEENPKFILILKCGIIERFGVQHFVEKLNGKDCSEDLRRVAWFIQAEPSRFQSPSKSNSQQVLPLTFSQSVILPEQKSSHLYVCVCVAHIRSAKTFHILNWLINFPPPQTICSTVAPQLKTSLP